MATRAATFCAFIDWGDDRKPWRYSRWVVGRAGHWCDEVVMSEG